MTKRNRAKEHHSKKINDLLKEGGPDQQKRVDNRMLLAAKIDDAIKAKGWNQSRLAKEMGKMPSEISKWLSGTHNFTSETLWDLEEKLGIQIIILNEKEPHLTKVAEFKTTVESEIKGHMMASFGHRTYVVALPDDEQKKGVRSKAVKYG